MKKALAIALATLTLVLALTPAAAFAAEGEVVKAGTCGECTWILYGDDGDLVVFPTKGESGQLTWDGFYPSWHDDSIRKDIKKVTFRKTVRPTTCDSMFYECTSLESIDLSGLDTSQVTYMGSMFSQCTSLKSIDLSGLDTSQVTHMGGMFSQCTSLESIDLSGLDTSGVLNMYYLFSNCTSLKSIGGLSALNTSQVTNMASMFGGCESLESLDLSGFDTSQVKSMESMFSECTALTSLDLSSFDTRKVERMGYMFFYDSNLVTITAGGLWSTDAVVNSDFMFKYCTRLVGDRETGYGLDNINVGYARIDNAPDAPGYLSRKGIEGAKLALSKASFTYNGKAQKPEVKMVVGYELRVGTDYDAAYSNAKSTNAGTYTVTVTGKGAYTGTAKASYTIAKAAQPMTANPKAKTVKAKKLAKKAATVKGAITVKGQKGAVSYKKVSATADKKAQKAAKKAKATKKLKAALKKFKVNAKNGTITVPKGLVKGTYSLKVKVTAKGDANHKAGSKTVTVKVKVK